MKHAYTCHPSNNGKIVVEQQEDAANANDSININGHSSSSQAPPKHPNSSGEATCISHDVAAMYPHHITSVNETSFRDNEQSSILPSSTNNNNSNETKISQTSSKPSCKRRRPNDASTMKQNRSHDSDCTMKPSNECNKQLNNQKINHSTAKNRNSTNFPNSERNANKNDLEQNSTPLTFLCLSKSWIAATKRAKSHPHEAQYGCTSSARSLLPLGSYDENDNDSNNDQTSSNHVFHGNSNNTNAMASSPLALVTRYGAPSDCIEAVLNAEKRMIQRCIPNRGTPLHEAIMLYPTSSSASSAIATVPSSENNGNDNSNSINHQIQEYVKIVRMLIKADELVHNEIESDAKKYGKNKKPRKLIKRATLAQDVDGNVPLHLLIRQAFYNYLGGMAADTSSPSNKQTPTDQESRDVEHPVLTVAKELIQSSPEAVSIPDCTEFEETPLILALKSSVYANEQHQQQQRYIQNNSNEDGIDYYNATLERKIFDICKIMLQSSPHAASRVMLQNGYTAVHSAVFHGRCSDIIRLLLNADEVNRKWNFNILKQNGGGDFVKMEIPATMQANKFGELPLHIATMRGECTRSIALLSQNAPWSVLRRDVKLGLTPLHWLWVRFVDRIVERFGEEGCTNIDDDKSDEDMKIDLNDDGMSDNADDLGGISFGNRSSFTSTNNTEILPGDLRSGNGHIHFDLEYHIRTEAIDPPVHYTRMRHIVPEYLKLEQKLTVRVIKVLRRVRERHRKMMDKMLLVKRLRDKNQAGPMNNLRHGTMNEHQDTFGDSASEQPKCPQEQMNSSSTNRCPFTGAREEVTSLPDSNQKCPYAHLASKASKKETKCPYSSANSIPQEIDTNESNKKCPFRCPFVFDSYPLSDDMKHFAGEQSVREEQVISLFWAKVTSLLQAAAMGSIVGIETAMTSPDLIEHIDFGKIYMLHTSCSSPCPAAIVKLCLELCHEQVREKDSSGKLPLHHVAMREIDPRELSILSKAKIASINRSASNNVIKSETARVLDMVLHSSPLDAAQTFDSEKRLPLHYMIDSVITGAVQRSLNMNLGEEGHEKRRKEAFDACFKPLKSLIDAYPEALETLDGQTQLFPIMQASSAAYESFCKAGARTTSNKISLSIVFSLLLEKPSIVSAMTPVK